MPARRPLAAALVLLVASSGCVVAAGALQHDATASMPRNDSAVPVDGPDHGVNESTFHRLWSDDADDNNLSMGDFDDVNVSSRADFTRRLAQSTDIPFDQPPTVVERWNRGDLTDFEPGDDSRSVHPADESLEDGRFIRDAYVSIFAVLPSTISHEGNETTQYVAQEGDVLAISDYRVAIPDNDGNESSDEWSLLESRIESVELSADGRRLDAGSGHRTTLSYADLRSATTLTVEATISVRLRRPTDDCSNEPGDTGPCDGSRARSAEIAEETLTVSATRPVVVNDVGTIDGRAVAFDAQPNRTGAVVHPGTAWSSIAVDGDVGELDLLTAFDGQLVVVPAVRAEVTTQPAAANLDRFCGRDKIETAVPADGPSMDGYVTRARTILDESDVNGDVRLVAAVLANTDADGRAAIVSDDRRLRTVADGLGATVTGTIGVIVRAVEAGRPADDAKAVLERVDSNGLHLTADLFETAVELVETAAEK